MKRTPTRGPWLRGPVSHRTGCRWIHHARPFGFVRVSLALVVAFTLTLSAGGILPQVRPASAADSISTPPIWIHHPSRPFSVTATEVTVSQFKACVDAGACDVAAVEPNCNYGTAGRGEHPVNCVTYGGAEQFCAFIGGRICKEDEWLDACRGTSARAYPYGDSFDLQACNTQSVTQTVPGRTRGTAPVASHPSCEGGLPGLFDMAGNVAEWVDSCKGSYCRFRGAGYLSNDPIDSFAGCSGICSGNDKSLQSGVVGIRCCRDEAP